MQTRANLTSCAFFSTNIPTGFKTKIRKSSREVESNLEKDGRKKMRAQWARLQSFKKKNKTGLKKKTVAIYIKHVFNNHDPGILSMRGQRRRVNNKV